MYYACVICNMFIDIVQDETIRLLHAYQFVAKHGEVSTAIVVLMLICSYNYIYTRSIFFYFFLFLSPFTSLSVHCLRWRLVPTLLIELSACTTKDAILVVCAQCIHICIV
jgi:hypothetical protein